MGLDCPGSNGVITMPHQHTYTLSCGGKSDAGRHVIVHRELKAGKHDHQRFCILVYQKKNTVSMARLTQAISTAFQKSITAVASLE